MPPLVEVRGAGGSGKSTIVRRIMARYSLAVPFHPELPVTFQSTKRGLLRWDGRSIQSAEEAASTNIRRRKRPCGYILSHPAVAGELFVNGHYETECGGTDTIPSMDLVYHFTRQHLEAGRSVLQEGRLLSWSDNERPLSMPEHPLALCLDVDLESCIQATLRRRAERGAETTEAKRFNIEKNARGEVRGVKSSGRRLAEAGCEVFWCSREEALGIAAERLGVAGLKERPLEDIGIGVPPKNAQATLW